MADVSATDVNKRHQPALDGIRGLAILCVLLSHAVDFLGPVPHGKTAPFWGVLTARIFIPGWGGVDLFFTLSGFLITGILLRARSSQRYFSSFYARRALRIFPIYYLALIATLIAASRWAEIRANVPSGTSQRASYFLYIANWPAFWDSWKGMIGLWGAYWSLNVEEQFYLVWPAVVKFLNIRLIAIFCVAGVLVGWLERSLLISHFGLMLGLMQWPFSRLDGLFAGALLAIYRFERGKPLPIQWALTLFGTGAALYTWVVIAHTAEISSMGQHIWTTGVSSFVLMSAGLVAGVEHRDSFFYRLFSARWLRAAGRYSYGMYIYHIFIYQRMIVLYESKIRVHTGQSPVVAVVYIALAITITFGVAALSFRFIEEPFLRMKRFFPSPAPAV